jgi:hypothetical protein
VNSERGGERPTVITIEATKSMARECQRLNIWKGHMVRIINGKLINHTKNPNIVKMLAISMTFLGRPTT